MIQWILLNDQLERFPAGAETGKHRITNHISKTVTVSLCTEGTGTLSKEYDRGQDPARDRSEGSSHSRQTEGLCIMQESEVIAKTDDLRVRIMVLAPREVADWHYHTEVTDDIFCLNGMISVRIREPDEDVRLTPGQRCQIGVGRVHQLENLEDMEASYLLVQGIGKYDFNIVDQKD